MSQETLSLTSGIETEASLTSGIETEVSLESGIAVGEASSPILEFDGGDYYDLPIPDDNNFDITFSVKNPGIVGFSGAFYLAAADSTWVAFLTSTNSALSKYYQLEISNSDASYQIALVGNVNSVDSFVKLRAVKSGNEISYYENDILINTVTATGTMSTFIYSALGGYGSGGEAAPSIPLLNGSQIKNVNGVSYKFGKSYTDTAKTTEAEINDNIAVILNDGSVGGEFIQSTAANRAILESFNSYRSILSLESSLL